MRVLHRVALLSVLVPAACAPVAPSGQDLATLKGQPVQPVIARLGAPVSQQKTGGGTSYSWTMETRVDVPERTTTTEYSAGRPNQVESTVLVPRMQSCTLSLLVDGSGLITAVQQDGPYQACSA